MYSLEYFDLSMYNNWDCNPENIELYNVFYNNKQIIENNAILIVVVDKNTKLVTPAIKILNSIFSYNNGSCPNRITKITKCDIVRINKDVSNFRDIISSDEFINFLKDFYNLLLEQGECYEI